MYCMAKHAMGESPAFKGVIKMKKRDIGGLSKEASSEQSRGGGSGKSSERSQKTRSAIGPEKHQLNKRAKTTRQGKKNNKGSMGKEKRT